MQLLLIMLIVSCAFSQDTLTTAVGSEPVKVVAIDSSYIGVVKVGEQTISVAPHKVFERVVLKNGEVIIENKKLAIGPEHLLWYPGTSLLYGKTHMPGETFTLTDEEELLLVKMQKERSLLTKLHKEQLLLTDKQKEQSVSLQGRAKPVLGDMANPAQNIKPSMMQIGGAFIALSAGIGLYQLNDEFDGDATRIDNNTGVPVVTKEFEDWLDKHKILSNIQYLTLGLGGIMITISVSI